MIIAEGEGKEISLSVLQKVFEVASHHTYMEAVTRDLQILA